MSRKRKASDVPSLDIVKAPKRRNLYYVGNFEFSAPVDFKRAKYERLLVQDLKSKIEDIEKRDWTQKKKNKIQLVNRTLTRRHKDEGENFEMRGEIKKTKRPVHCIGKPQQPDPKTTLVLLKIMKDGVAQALPIENSLLFQQQFENAMDIEEAEDLEKDEARMFQMKHANKLQKTKQMEKEKADAIDVTKINSERMQNQETDLDPEKARKQATVKSQRIDTGDYEAEFTDDEELRDNEEILDTKEEESEEIDNEEDSDYQKMNNLLTNPKARKQNFNKKKETEIEFDSDDSDSISDYSSEEESQTQQLTTKGNIRKVVNASKKELKQRKKEAEQISKKLKQGSSALEITIYKILQSHPQGIKTKDLLPAIHNAVKINKNELIQKAKPILKKLCKPKKVKGKNEKIWILRPNEKNLNPIVSKRNALLRNEIIAVHELSSKFNKSIV